MVLDRPSLAHRLDCARVISPPSAGGDHDVPQPTWPIRRMTPFTARGGGQDSGVLGFRVQKGPTEWAVLGGASGGSISLDRGWHRQMPFP